MVVKGTEVKFNTSLNGVINIPDLNFKISNKKKYVISALTQGEIWFIVCWKYDKYFDNGNGKIGDYVNEYSRYVKSKDFPIFKKLIECRKVDKTINHNNDDILQSVQKYINKSKGDYHIEYVTVKEGNIVTDIQLNLNSVTKIKIPHDPDLIVKIKTVSYIYHNGNNYHNLHNYNIKLLGLPKVYKWKNRIRSKLIIDKIDNMLPSDVDKYVFNSYKSWTFEKLYSFLKEIYNSEKATKLLQLEI